MMTVLLLLLGSALRLELAVSEGGEKTSYLIDVKPGVMRIAPEAATEFLLFESAGPRLTLVRPTERSFCRLSRESLQRLAEWDIVRLAWFPWVYRASRDLLDDTTLTENAPHRFEVLSKTYARVVAVYEVDPRVSPALFFPWRESYLDFFSEGEADADEASRKRLEIYARLPGMPLFMEERFAALTRPRTTRVLKRTPIGDDVFRWPDDYAEESAGDLLREAALARLKTYLGLPSSKKDREREKREDAVRDRKK